MSEFDYPLHAENDNRSAQVIQIDNGKHTNTVVMCAILCTLTFVGTLWAWHKADNAETESRLVQYYLQDPNSRTPEELAAWAKFVREHAKE